MSCAIISAFQDFAQSGVAVGVAIGQAHAVPSVRFQFLDGLYFLDQIDIDAIIRSIGERIADRAAVEAIVSVSGVFSRDGDVKRHTHHENFGHGRSLATGRGDANQHPDAIRL